MHYLYSENKGADQLCCYHIYISGPLFAGSLMMRFFLWKPDNNCLFKPSFFLFFVLQIFFATS